MIGNQEVILGEKIRAIGQMSLRLDQPRHPVIETTSVDLDPGRGELCRRIGRRPLPFAMEVDRRHDGSHREENDRKLPGSTRSTR